jgi:alanyl-tRNA synthetase
MPPQTERLYNSDPYLREFQASVQEIRNATGGYGLVLDRTAFYPEGGGQPSDQGTMNGAPVTSVLDDGEDIIHIVEGMFQAGEPVKGILDWNRRFDHMQQHSGQHLLSQAFIGLLNASTLSFHLGTENATIDLGIPDLSEDGARKVENEVNRLLNENRSIRVYEKPAGQLDGIPLRKRPDIPGVTARIVEIENFDWSLCCGTHVRNTGEIGIIKILGWEKYKGGVRLQFSCGTRALREFQAKHNLVKFLTIALTAGENEIAEIVTHMKDDRKITEKKIQILLDQVLETESKKLLKTAKDIGSVKLVSAFLGQRDLREAQGLVRKLVSSAGVIAVIGAVHDRATVFFARSDGLDLDLRPALQTALTVMNAKGGGSPHWAQCSTTEVDKIEQGIKNATEMIKMTLSGH